MVATRRPISFTDKAIQKRLFYAELTAAVYTHGEYLRDLGIDVDSLKWAKREERLTQSKGTAPDLLQEAIKIGNQAADKRIMTPEATTALNALIALQKKYAEVLNDQDMWAVPSGRVSP